MFPRQHQIAVAFHAYPWMSNLLAATHSLKLSDLVGMMQGIACCHRVEGQIHQNGRTMLLWTFQVTHLTSSLLPCVAVTDYSAGAYPGSKSCCLKACSCGLFRHDKIKEDDTHNIHTPSRTIMSSCGQVADFGWSASALPILWPFCDALIDPRHLRFAVAVPSSIMESGITVKTVSCPHAGRQGRRLWQIW